MGLDSFTVRGPRGAEFEVAVTGSTVYYTNEGAPAAFSDIQVGARVMGAVERDADGNLTARLVIIFPPRTRYVGGGVIAGVDAEEQSFTMVTLRGRVWEFYVDDATLITGRDGQALTFSDLKQGARTLVHAELRSDGQWWATEIKVGRGAAPGQA